MNHNKKLTALAQNLRKNMTKEEKHLWYDFLRNYPKQFRRQVTVGQYILDFYCAEANLAVELDGSQHYEPENQIKDEQRTAFLNARGVRVIRFSNLDVLKNFEGVCKAIDMAIALPFGEGGPLVVGEVNTSSVTANAVPPSTSSVTANAVPPSTSSVTANAVPPSPKGKAWGKAYTEERQKIKKRLTNANRCAIIITESTDDGCFPIRLKK